MAISIIPAELKQSANRIREQIAEPFAQDMDTFYNDIQTFVEKSYVSDASREKARQIIAKKELLQRMYNVMHAYANFLDEAAGRFVRTDQENIQNFTKY